MALYYISSGETSSGITLNPSDRMHVLCGGMVNDTIVTHDSELVISSGGMTNNTIVSDGGKLVVSSGGMANTTTLTNEGLLVISSGGMANDTTVSKGAILVFSNGMANGANIMENGSLFVLDGGITNNVSRMQTPYTYSEPDQSGDTAEKPCSLVDVSEHPNGLPRPGQALPSIPQDNTPYRNIENRFFSSDLTECRFRDPARINALIRSIDPVTKETDRLQVVALFYAINTGETLASNNILARLGFTHRSSGQFGYYKRIVKLFRDLSYRIEVVKDNPDNAAEEIADAGIDGFEYGSPNTFTMYHFFEEESSYTLEPQDITHLVSFLYSVVKRTLMPQIEYDRFEHGPTTQQYGYYHRAIHWLTKHGYRIAVRKVS